MELYDWNAKPLSDGFPIAVRTYILRREESRSILYSGRKCRVSIPAVQALAATISSLPTAIQAGGIFLRIDCRPYTPLSFYCLLIQVRSGCRGLWCLFQFEWQHWSGALLHGHYYAMEYQFDFYRLISPLYRAELFTGELPENCSFMKLLEKSMQTPATAIKLTRCL